MITFITGIPGSGKTALAVKEIITTQQKYCYIYTNINDFDFSKIPNSKELKFSEIYNVLLECYNLQVRGSSDDELLNFLKEHCLEKVLFVIDECHNYFDGQDILLVWWLSYHRHLHHDIILITQNLSLVNSKYKAFSEVFYRASSPSTRFLKHILKYNKYIDSRMTQASHFGMDTINTKHIKVFDYYKSGFNQKGKSIFKKYLVIGAVLFIILFIAFKLFLGSFGGSSNKKTTPIVPPQTQLSIQNTNTSISSKDSFKSLLASKAEKYTDTHLLINFHCVGGVCYINNKRFSFTEITFLVNNTNSLFLPLKQNTKVNYISGSFLASLTLQNILGVYNEDESLSSRTGLPVISNSR